MAQDPIHVRSKPEAEGTGRHGQVRQSDIFEALQTVGVAARGAGSNSRAQRAGSCRQGLSL